MGVCNDCWTFLDNATYACGSASVIYCTGELLRQVQMEKLFDDNKAFVDMKLTASPGENTDLLRFFPSSL